MCFTNLITVDDTCDDQVSESGLTLKDIGISMDFLDAINYDYASGKELAQAKIDFAVKLVVNQIVTHFSKSFRATTVVDGKRIGFTQENLVAKQGVNHRGVQIEICNQSSYVDFYLSSLSLQLTTAPGATDIFVYDLLQDKLLDTLSITPAANEIVTIYPNKTYKSDRKRLNIALLYDSTGLSSVNTLLTQSGCQGCGGSSNYVSRYVTARGVEIPEASTKIESNLTGVDHTSGLSLTYSVNCNHQDWLCDKRNLIAQSILYKAASEINRYGAVNSSRFNTKTIVDKEKITKDMDDFEFRYRESIDNVVNYINIPQDNKCFKCDEPLKYVTGYASLPS